MYYNLIGLRVLYDISQSWNPTFPSTQLLFSCFRNVYTLVQNIRSENLPEYLPMLEFKFLKSNCSMPQLLPFVFQKYMGARNVSKACYIWDYSRSLPKLESNSSILQPLFNRVQKCIVDRYYFNNNMSDNLPWQIPTLEFKHFEIHWFHVTAIVLLGPGRESG
jgi:hypothetical protein